MGTGRHSSERQSSSTAEPATPHASANWSISPLRTPTYPFSPRWQICASVSGSTSVATSPSIAQADASSIAADDESPAFGGSVVAMTPRNPRSGAPVAASAQAVPAT